MTNTQIAVAQLGSTGPTVGRIGLGAMGMSGSYGPADSTESTATVHAALDSGARLVDTGDFYAMGHNEMLVGRAIADRPREETILSVKFGGMIGPDGTWQGFDGRPAALRNFLSYSLRRLGVDHVDIYRPARLDPAVPIEDTVGAIAELVDAGYVRYIGLSEVGAETLRRAAAVHPIADLQIEYSLFSRGIETAILPVCRELGIGITAYGVLSRGLLSDTAPGRSTEFAQSDYRAHSPRFQGDNLAANLELVDALAALAQRKGVSTAQLAIAWVLSRGDDIVPVIGSRTRARWSEALGALDVTLDDADIAAVEAAVPAEGVAGSRYAQAQMKALDSER
ncbi:aldo/keto reductase [Nocardia jinanensis]|uniref:Aldo/keto reductase n=1 Tax=Nocardia jinanensis TaxID=382504 RepID=A0A917VYG5_9NOCA|nr:aldo/keto reductase [Nocardia jinanensis]GGL37190.1 aldo/keto reductase [Nocardia jinanensis]